MGLAFNHFSKYPNLRYGISGRADGNMKLNFDSTDTINYTNRKVFFRERGVSNDSIITAKLAHRSTIKQIHSLKKNKNIYSADGFVTNLENIYLTVTVADCFPIYFYSPDSKFIALLHAGWRSISLNIVGKACTLLSSLHINLHTTLVGIGPGIRLCHFEIQDDVQNIFSDHNNAILKNKNKTFVDLPLVLRSKLAQGGIKSENVRDSIQCTACSNEEYFSYRTSSQKEIIHAMIAYIGMAADNQ